MISPVRNFSNHFRFSAILLALGSLLCGSVHGESSSYCSQLFNAWNKAETAEKTVFSTLGDASLGKSNEGFPESTIAVDGLPIRRRSQTSKWRAIVVESKSDVVSEQGFQSGKIRFGDTLPEWDRSDFSESTGSVTYRFGNGNTVVVSSPVARALEFSFIDQANPKSPKAANVVGLHDDPLHVLEVVRQSGAEKLRDKAYYFLLAEVETRDLPILSSEALYERFSLKNPNYSPAGEWVVDGSIPAENVLAIYRFKVEKSESTLKDGLIDRNGGRVTLGSEVYYTAISGKKYFGKVASERVVDGYLIVSYVNRHGELKFDVAKADELFNMKDVDDPLHRFAFDSKAVQEEFGRSHPDFEKIISTLKRDENLKRLFESDSGVFEGFTIGDHTQRVFNVLMRNSGIRESIAHIRTAGGMPGVEFLAKVIVVHDIGKSRAMGAEGISSQHRFTQTLAKKILSQIGLVESDLKLADALLSDDFFGRVFNARTPVDKRLEVPDFVSQLKAKAIQAEVPLKEFFLLLQGLYSADATSYDIVRDQYFELDSQGIPIPRDPRYEDVRRLVNSTGI